MADTKSMVDEILKRVLMRIDGADLSKATGATGNASCASSPVSSYYKSTTNFNDY